VYFLYFSLLVQRKVAKESSPCFTAYHRLVLICLTANLYSPTTLAQEKFAYKLKHARAVQKGTRMLAASGDF
jgi:hypothetical protein